MRVGKSMNQLALHLSSGRSHVGWLLPVHSGKGLVRDVSSTFATRGCLVHDITNKGCCAQNDSSNGGGLSGCFSECHLSVFMLNFQCRVFFS